MIKLNQVKTLALHQVHHAPCSLTPRIWSMMAQETTLYLSRLPAPRRKYCKLFFFKIIFQCNMCFTTNVNINGVGWPRSKHNTAIVVKEQTHLIWKFSVLNLNWYTFPIHVANCILIKTVKQIILLTSCILAIGITFKRNRIGVGEDLSNFCDLIKFCSICSVCKNCL